MKKEIKAVAFDIDGTLYSDFALYIRVIPYVVKNLSFFLAFSRVRKILHHTAPLSDFYEYQARLLAEELKISNTAAKEKINKIVYKGLAPYFTKIKPVRHVKETLIALKEAGYKIGILSDFPPEQKGNLWGMFSYCDVILGSEACGALKPSLYPFGLLAKDLDVLPEEILYVGNSIRCDVMGANNAKMKSAYFMTGWRKFFNRPLKVAYFSFKNYRQLKDFMLN